MKTLWLGLAFLVAAGTLAAAPATPVADSSVVVADSVSTPDVIAYYFHTAQRCATCRKLEAHSREAIETGFPAELKSGRLVWKVVNIEEKGNEHFVEDYRLYTKALVLVDLRKGQETHWQNLEKIWELVHDKEEFVAYVQSGVRDFLVKPKA